MVTNRVAEPGAPPPKAARFSLVFRVWQNTPPAGQRRFATCLPFSLPRVARDRAAACAPLPGPLALRLPDQAWAAGLSCHLTSKFEIRSVVLNCLSGARQWNLRQALPGQLFELRERRIDGASADLGGVLYEAVEAGIDIENGPVAPPNT